MSPQSRIACTTSPSSKGRPMAFSITFKATSRSVRDTCRTVPFSTLDRQNGQHPLLLLGGAIGIPCLAYPHPGPRRLLQQRHLGVAGHLGMMDRDAVLQQARGPHIGHRHRHLVQGVRGVLQEIGETLRRHGHTDHQGHRDQARLGVPEEESLDRGLGLLGELAAGSCPGAPRRSPGRSDPGSPWPSW